MKLNGIFFFKTPSDIHESFHQGEIDYITPVKYKFTDSKEWSDITYGRFLIWEISGWLPEEALGKKGVKTLVTQICQKYPQEVAIKKLKEVQDIAFHVATVKNISLGMDDFTPMEGTGELMQRTKEELSLIPESERAVVWDKVINGEVDRWIREVDRNNPLYYMYCSGARVTPSQIRQMIVGKGLLTQMDGTLNPNAITESLSHGLNTFNYFQTCGPARRGLANNFFVVPASGYFARQLVNAARDLTIIEEDCGTDAGMKLKLKHSLGRFTRKGHLITQEDIEAWKAEGETTVEVRSPIHCQSTKGGLCSKCCGVDPANLKPWRVGFGLGTAAAQHISEPATQAGLRGKHTSGSVTLADFENSVGNVLSNVIYSFGGIGTQFVPTSGATSKCMSDFTKEYKDQPLKAAEKLSEHIKEVFETSGLGVSSIHIEVIIRSCVEQVVRADGEVGLRSFGDVGNIKPMSVAQVPLNYPSWLKSVSYGYTKDRLKKAVLNMEKTYGVVTEQIITTAFQHHEA